jgi:Family of unknown function (DUF5335)
MSMVDKSHWQAATDLLSRQIHGQPARLEVASLRLGDQVAAEWSPLLGVTYDPKDDLFEIRLEGLDHLVTHPSRFDIHERAGLADSLMVVDGDGIEHILQLRQPIQLPPTP